LGRDDKSFESVVVPGAPAPAAPSGWCSAPAEIHLLFIVQSFGLLELFDVGSLLFGSHAVVSLGSDAHDVGGAHVRVLLLYLHALARHEQVVCVPRFFQWGLLGVAANDRGRRPRPVVFRRDCIFLGLRGRRAGNR